MTLKLWALFEKRNNSTKQPSGNGTELNVRLKEGTSYLHPVFILNSDNAGYNYCYFRGRYYFIDDIISIGNGLSEYHCSVDVLATWKAQIGLSRQYILRAGSTYNPNIIDNYYPALASSTTSKYPLNTIHNGIVTTGYYVIGVIGKNASVASGAVNYYALSDSDMRSLLNFMFNISGYDIDPDEISQDLQKALINPFQYIVSAIWLPGTIPTGTPAHIHFGWWESSTTGHLLSESDRNEHHSMVLNFLPYRHPKALTQGLNYLSFAPFTKMMLDCYMFGTIPLDPVCFSTYAGNIIINIDRFTGIGELVLQSASGAVVYKATAQMGVPVQLAQLTQNLASSVISGVEGAIALAQGRIASGTSGIVSAIESAVPQMATTGSNGSTIAYNIIPSITFIHYDIVATDKSHFGAPLCQNKQILELAGYIMCEDADVDIPGTSEEKNQINAYMDGGFFYE